jgi:arylsulfatase A-like enzyme
MFAWVAGLLLATSSAEAAQTKPDIFLVVWDTTRPDHLSPYGYAKDTTPNLKKFSEKATIFDNAFAAGAWTVPSVASLFTGMFTHNHTVDYAAKEFAVDIPAEATTLAEHLKAGGYKTAIYTAQGIYYKNAGFIQGFDTAEKVSEAKIHDKALAFVDDAGDTPTFVVMYYLNPHAPYEPEAAHNLFTDPNGPKVNIRGCGKDDEREWPEGYQGHCDVNQGKVTLDPKQWEQLRGLYDGEIHHNDALFGQFVGGLSERKILDESMVVVTADHGEGFDEHPRQRTWHSLPYDTILRIPLIVRHPKSMPAKHVPQLVRNPDIFPTIAEAAGLPVTWPINGLSLAPLAANASAPDDRILVGTSHWVDAPQFFRSAAYKYIVGRNKPSVELFDVAKDPGETRNLASEMPRLVEALQQKLTKFIEESTVPLAKPAAGATDEELQRLRELGYVE